MSIGLESQRALSDETDLQSSIKAMEGRRPSTSNSECEWQCQQNKMGVASCLWLHRAECCTAWARWHEFSDIDATMSTDLPGSRKQKNRQRLSLHTSAASRGEVHSTSAKRARTLSRWACTCAWSTMSATASAFMQLTRWNAEL